MSGSAVPGAFASGASVVGIASDISLLPKEVVEAADLTVEIEPLRGADVRKIIYAVIGAKSVPPVDDAISSALTPTQLAAAIRPLTTAAACLTRLRVVAERALKLTLNRDAPSLEDLAGYGEAQIWGMDLKRDTEKRRANRSAVSVDMLTRSILLAGIPGTGKTLFASALARSCRIPLVETSYGIWQSAGAGHLGDLTVAMRKAFSDAAQAARSNDVGCAVLLIDEVDSIPSRTSSAGTNENFWWIAVQNAMLTLSERDAPIRRGVILIGATNHPERLDPAFTRPGRIGDRIITISLPDAAEFAAMLRTHMGADLPDVDLQAIGRLASRMTGAEAARIVRDARQVARNADRPLTVADLIGQLLPPETRLQQQLLQIAHHEAAHAVIGLVVAGTKLETVTLCVPGAEGVTHFTTIPEQPMTRRHFEAQILVYLAGRAADDVFHEVDAGSGGGPGSDLALATRLCASIHRAYGLGDEMLSFGSPDSAVASLRVDPGFRKIVEADLQRLYVRAKAMVVERKADIEHVARELVRRRFLSAEDVKDILTRTARSRVPSGRVPTRDHNG